jgi:drug/metabolite transporter (DMT)-like permease
MGEAAALGSAFLWALTSTLMGFQAARMPAPVINALRSLYGSLFLGAVAAALVVAAPAALVAGYGLMPGRYGRRAWAVLVVLGVVGTGVGSLLFVVALQHAGAAHTAVLSSTAPVFALPLAVLALRERLTARVIAGTLLSLAGIWLLV